MRYPTRNRLIISPYELGYHQPTPVELGTKRLVTRHHGYFNHARYNDVRFHSVFRSLVDHVFPMLGEEHNLGHNSLHGTYDAPQRPPDALMIEVLDDYLALNGIIECVREKQTCSTYKIQPEEWAHIKKGYNRRNND